MALDTYFGVEDDTVYINVDTVDNGVPESFHVRLVLGDNPVDAGYAAGKVAEKFAQMGCPIEENAVRDYLASANLSRVREASPKS